MRIFDITKTIELTKEQCDLTKGRLKESTILIADKEEYIWVYTPYTQKELFENEINEIKYWFENEYREIFEKCSRKIAIGINLRDGSDPKTTLNDLYTQAEIKSNRIHQLEDIIKIL